MSFVYRSTVTEEEFKQALLDMEKAIAVKDTPEEWAKFASRTLLAVAQIAINQVGFGPALDILEELFGDNEDIMKILKLLGEASNED